MHIGRQFTHNWECNSFVDGKNGSKKKHAENGQGGKANLDEKQCRCTKGCNLMGSNQKVHLKGGGQLVIHGALPCCVLAGQVLRNSTGQMSGKAKTLHAVKGALIQKGGGRAHSPLEGTVGPRRVGREEGGRRERIAPTITKKPPAKIRPSSRPRQQGRKKVACVCNGSVASGLA